MQHSIKVMNLTKFYGEKQVLGGISFGVESGKTFGLLGVNGAGKTTTIECIEGLRKPDSGEITIGGFDVSKSASVKKMLGVQLQSTAFPESMTAKEAMKLFCAWHYVAFRRDLLERFDMAGEYLNKPYSTLSTGRKRRLHLALSLCHNPKILILDEPTAGLDVEGRHALHNEIRGLKSAGVTILIATHDMSEAETLCDCIAILSGGQIVKQGSPLELTAAAGMKSRVILKTAKHTLKSLPLNNVVAKQLPEEYLSFDCNDSADLLLALLNAIKQNGDSVVDLRVERAGIEDIFMSIAGGTSK